MLVDSKKVPSIQPALVFTSSTHNRPSVAKNLPGQHTGIPPSYPMVYRPPSPPSSSSDLKMRLTKAISSIGLKGFVR